MGHIPLVIKEKSIRRHKQKEETVPKEKATAHRAREWARPFWAMGAS
jgi:hypothetical protein